MSLMTEWRSAQAQVKPIIYGILHPFNVFFHEMLRAEIIELEQNLDDLICSGTDTENLEKALNRLISEDEAISRGRGIPTLYEQWALDAQQTKNAPALVIAK